MRGLWNQANLVRPIAVALLTALLSGCVTHWSRTDLEPQHLPNRIRVTLTNGYHMQLECPTIIGDTLVGFNPGRRSIPLAQVKLAQTRKIDGAATAGLIGGALAVATFVGALVMSPGEWTFGGGW